MFNRVCLAAVLACVPAVAGRVFGGNRLSKVPSRCQDRVPELMLMLDNVTGGCGIPYLTTGPDLAKGNKTITRAVVVMPDSGGNPTIEYCAISQNTRFTDDQKTTAIFAPYFLDVGDKHPGPGPYLQWNQTNDAERWEGGWNSTEQTECPNNSASSFSVLDKIINDLK
eukprot:gene24727-28476_t